MTIADLETELDRIDMQRCVSCERVDRLAWYAMWAWAFAFGTGITVLLIVFLLTDH